MPRCRHRMPRAETRRQGFERRFARRAGPRREERGCSRRWSRKTVPVSAADRKSLPAFRKPSRPCRDPHASPCRKKPPSRLLGWRGSQSRGRRATAAVRLFSAAAPKEGRFASRSKINVPPPSSASLRPRWLRPRGAAPAPASGNEPRHQGREGRLITQRRTDHDDHSRHRRRLTNPDTADHPTARVHRAISNFTATSHPQASPIPARCPIPASFDGAISDIFDILAGAFQDTRLEPDLDDLLWHLTDLFHKKSARVQRQLEDNEDRQKRSQQEQDGSEIRSVELERLIAPGAGPYRAPRSLRADPRLRRRALRDRDRLGLASPRRAASSTTST